MTAATLTDLPNLLSHDEVASYLRISLREVERLVRDGRLSAYELPNGRVLVERGALLQFLELCRAARA